MSISNEKPRFPGTTIEDRQAVYREVLGLKSFQAVAATATLAAGQSREATRVKRVYAVLNQTLDSVGPETLRIDVGIAIPRTDGAAPLTTSILSAPVTFGHGSGSGTQEGLPLSAAFIATGNLVPAGSELVVTRTLANGSVTPANGVFIELEPAS